MREAQEPDDESLPPSRSQLRRDALEIFKLAEALVAFGEAQLERMPLDDEVRNEVLRTRAIGSNIARKRQTQYLAKQLRSLSDEELEPIRRALSRDKQQSHRDAAVIHRIEAWRERLIDEGDDALGELLSLHPTADRQHLRQLARNALAERKAGKPPHAYRELFRALRALAGMENRESGID